MFRVEGSGCLQIVGFMVECFGAVLRRRTRRRRSHVCVPPMQRRVSHGRAIYRTENHQLVREGRKKEEEEEEDDDERVARVGPVMLNLSDQRHVGAVQHTNNTAELTAIAKAFTWLNTEAPGDPPTPAFIVMLTYSMPQKQFRQSTTAA